MCLQDIKLGKTWEPVNYSQSASGALGLANQIPASGARRKLTITIVADWAVTFTVVNLFYKGADPAIAIHSFTDQLRSKTFSIDDIGSIIYGPFELVDASGIGGTVYISELRAHTDEELVK